MLPNGATSGGSPGKSCLRGSFGGDLRQRDTVEEGTNSSFDLCIVGRDEFDGALDRILEKEQDGGLPERRLRLSNGVADWSGAIVFLGRLERERIDQVPAEFAGGPVLTVSDMRFLQHGGRSELETRARQVGFAVALVRVDKAGPGLSSQLLKTTLSVTGSPKRERR